MKNAFGCILGLFVLLGCANSVTEPELDICQQYDWSKVEQLVAPHLDEVLHSALVMQGQNANYVTSEAARFAYNDVNDKKIKGILKQIIDANCGYQ